MGWRHKSSRLWRQHRLLFIVFVVAMALSAFFVGRAVVFYAYWSTHREVPIENWMTVGYVARSHDVDREILREALGLDPDQPDRRSLAQIAADRGVSVDTLIDIVEAAIARAKASPP